MLVTWTSTARVSSAVEPDSGPAVDLEALYSRWEAAPNKGTFVISLSPVEAAALVALARDRMPVHQSQPRTKKATRTRSRRGTNPKGAYHE